MSIEIDVLNGDTSWKLAEPLLNAVWPPHIVAKLPWADVVFAHADLRVLVRSESDEIVCHIGIFHREVTWNGRRMRAAGVGGVATREDVRCQGYASLALNAAIHTLREERSVDFAMLFCEPRHAAFYMARGWKPFAGEIHAEQPGGRVRFEVTAPYVHDLKRAPRQGVIDLCGLPW